MNIQLICAGGLALVYRDSEWVSALRRAIFLVASVIMHELVQWTHLKLVSN